MFLDLLFRLAPAIHAVFEMGYEVKEAFFYELTAEQYRELASHGKDLSKKWYALIPQNPNHDIADLLVVDEEEKLALLDAVAHINRLCEKEVSQGKLGKFEDRLRYAAKLLPEAMTRATAFEADAKKPNLSIVPPKA